MSFIEVKEKKKRMKSIFPQILSEGFRDRNSLHFFL